MAQKLQIVFGADTTEFNRATRGVSRELDVIGRSAGQLRSALTGIFAGVSIGGFAAFTKDTLEYADAIDKAADKIGLGTEALQELRQAAASSAGVGQGQLDVAMQRFSRRVGEAAQGTGDLVKVLDQYDIKVRDTAGVMRPLEDILGDYANAIKGAESEQEKLRLAFKGFDSEGAALVNTLRNGKQGLDDLRQAARDAGTVLEDSAIRAAAALNDKWDTAIKGAETQFRSFVLSVVDGWSQIIERFQYGLDLGSVGVSLSSAVTELNAQLVTARGELDRLLNAKGRNKASAEAVQELKDEIAQLERRRNAAVQKQYSVRNPQSPATAAYAIPGPIIKAGVKLEDWAKVKPSLQREVVRLQKDMERDLGIKIPVSSAYRPGKGSNHRTGDAVDLGFGGLSAADQKRASDYYLANSARYRLSMGVPGERPGDALTGGSGPHWHVQLQQEQKAARTPARTPADTAALRQAREAQAAFNALLSEAASIYERTRTPAEAYVDTVAKLRELYDAGAFENVGGMDTFARGLESARDGMDAAIASAGELKTELTGMQVAAYDFGQTFSSALEDAIVSGGSFSDILKGLGDDLLRMITRLAITNQIMNAVSGFTNPGAQKLPTLFADGGRIHAGVGAGIYNSPVYFPMPNPRRFATGGIGVLGEAGPEAVVPLPDGKSIPVDMRGAGASVEINIIESPGQGGQQRERSGSGGSRIIDILVERVRGDMAGDVASGGGLARAIESTYGLNRAAGGF